MWNNYNAVFEQFPRTNNSVGGLHLVQHVQSCAKYEASLCMEAMKHIEERRKAYMSQE